MSSVAETVDVVIGVDTHRDSHAAAVVAASTAVVVSQCQIDTNPDGYRKLLETVTTSTGVGGRRLWAIEGANSYGNGLAQYLMGHGEIVAELDRPERPKRRGGVKTDEVDAIRAAREALTRTRLGEPRQGQQRQRLANLLVIRRSAVQAAGDAQRQLRSLIVTGPVEVREQLRHLSTARLLDTLIETDTTGDDTDTVVLLQTLAQRVRNLQSEARQHERVMNQIIKDWRPDLLATHGVGTIVAATILCAWSHKDRFPSDAAFAMLAGTAPIPASSGQTTRHRLNRGGDRQLNTAIHTIMVTRTRQDPTTRAYIERRQTEGKTKREIQRCLKRHITRQIFKQLQHPPT